jgi:hypothetical protein
MNPKKSFGELKRRNIYKVAVAYAVVAWLLIQVATQVFPPFEIPNWAIRLVVLLLIIGFPLALVFAWAFELTPEGLKRTEDVDLNKSIHFGMIRASRNSQSRKRRNNFAIRCSHGPVGRLLCNENQCGAGPATGRWLQHLFSSLELSGVRRFLWCTLVQLDYDHEQEQEDASASVEDNIRPTPLGCFPVLSTARAHPRAKKCLAGSTRTRASLVY